uniref:FBD domain-containing protein n=1 Tax=Oryza meridionalis TaxID=40149 RepID=A0A0E0C0R9_9ORYZ
MSIKATYFGLSVFFKPVLALYVSAHRQGIFDAVMKGHIDFQSVLMISDSAKDLIEKKSSHCSSERLKDHEVLRFYGQKDQLELALYILQNSVRLKSMKINPKPIIAEYLGEVRESEGFFFLDGYQVALKFLQRGSL